MNGELRSKKDSLESLWQQGMSGRKLLQRHALLIDDFISRHFNEAPVDNNDIALVALGGYGRNELYPFSDIDLLLLYAPEAEKRLNPIVESIFYPLWDAGLEVGHSVRTVEQSIDDAHNDFFFQVSLVDARFITGENTLFTGLTDRFEKKYIEGRRREFLTEMLSFRKSRHHNFGAQAYLLEPQIKENRGGFRDIQAMLWTARVIFGLPNLAAMEDAGLLGMNEKKQFETAWNFLIKTRNRLHYLSGRKNDQLFFEHQEEIAKALSYKNVTGLLGVERFMRDLYHHMQVIAVTTDLFFEHVNEVMEPAKGVRSGKLLETGIELRQERLHFTEANFIEKKPALMMRILAIAARSNKPLHHRAKKIIRESLRFMDDRTRNSKRVAQSLIDVLLHGKESRHALEDLLDTGLLAAYLPEFKTVESLAQHDIYHVYTVDSHQLQTVTELHKLCEEESLIAERIDNLHLLLLAGLLHDIGKGKGSRHAERGAAIVAEIGIRMGLMPEDQEILEFLVANHLFLTNTALRRDLEDEIFVARCAEKIGSQERLDMLFLLSIADARATGPSVWNEWKHALLLELFYKISHILEQDTLETTGPEKHVEWMRQRVTALLGDTTPVAPEMLPDDYLVGFSPEQITSHVKLRNDLEEKELILRAKEDEGRWTILILTHDRPGLLAKICGVFALHNLDVLDAQIFTWLDGTVVDQIEVGSTIGQQFKEQDWQAVENDLTAAAANRLGLTHRLNRKLPPAGRTPTPAGRSRRRVIVDNDTAQDTTMIEIFAHDRPGLLYELTKTLADFDISIHRAKIAKEAEKVIDVFYVSYSDGQKINDPNLAEEIRQALLFVISGPD